MMRKTSFGWMRTVGVCVVAFTAVVAMSSGGCIIVAGKGPCGPNSKCGSKCASKCKTPCKGADGKAKCGKGCSKPCCAKKTSKTGKDSNKPCCAKKAKGTADAGSPCQGAAALTAAPAKKGGCSKPCGKPCGSKGTKVAKCGKDCNKPCCAKKAAGAAAGS